MVISTTGAYGIFIQAYCRLQLGVPGSQILQVDDIPCVQFSEPVENALYEFLVCGKAPRLAADTILKHFADKPHWLTIAAPEINAAREALIPTGYEPHDVEYLMIRKVKKTAKEPGIWPVHHLSSFEEAEEINGIRDMQVLTAGQVNDGHIQTYYIKHEEAVASDGIVVYGSENEYYIASIYTRPDCRKKGMAVAIMQKIFLDARIKGFDLAVLLSSQAGHNLYHRLGFEDLSPVVILFYPGITRS